MQEANNTFYTLVYLLMAWDDDLTTVESKLKGPTIHKTHGEAVRAMLEVVKPNICDHLESFIDDQESHGVDVSHIVIDDSNTYDKAQEELGEFLSTLPTDQMESAVQWYFDVYREDNPDSFYRIESQSFPTA
ncbi:hypothetical protein [Neptuniibacter sp. QD37_11]|uniref:hypothetical protein n=1 Tax=Neptuniibacter sp. QD37_11 TaxID=3398209 RepID=UPI0039F5D0D7